MSRQLVVLLAMLALAGGTLAVSPRERHEIPSFASDRLPALVDG
jgi:hypothetical protein